MHRGHHYLTLVYQLDVGQKRLLWLGPDRTVKTLLRFFGWLGPQRSAALRFVCSDMWKPYLRVVAKKAGHALHIVDRFHIMAHLNKAIDEVRAQEARALRARGAAPLLMHTRWLLLTRPENLTAQQEPRLAALLHHNLRAVRSYLLREDHSRGLRGHEVTAACNSLAEAYLLSAERCAAQVRAESLRKARHACRVALRQGGRFRGGLPAALRWRGSIEWLSGNRRSADKWWERSLGAAKQLGARYETGVTNLEMGRRRGDVVCLERAIGILTELGARVDLGVAYRNFGRSRTDPNQADPAAAAPPFEQGITLLTETNADHELAMTYRAYGGLQERLGRSTEARDYLSRAIEIFEGLGNATGARQRAGGVG